MDRCPFSSAYCLFLLKKPLPALPVCKTVLDNGLTLLILEKRDVPIVTSTIWYNIGSAHEQPGHTGLAHFLEHLMFKGTPTYGKGVIDALTAAYGGHNNAGTIFDYTMYYFNFSSDRWDLALEIEADRMQHCLFAPDELEAERRVVIEELKRQEDSPWGKLNTHMESAMFPDHPYCHPVIGWPEDLEQITRDAVMEYYQTYYVPNNATIVIVGDVDTPVALDKVQRHFASIPANLDLPELSSSLAPQQAEQRVTLRQETALKRVQIGYHATSLADPDNYALDCIDYLLSHGKTSRLYQRLVEQEQLVAFVDTLNHPRRFPGAFYLFGALRPGVDPEKVEHVVDEELRRLHTEPASEDELRKIKKVIEADFIFEKETVSGLAYALGEYETLHTYDYIDTYITRIEQVTAEDIMRVAHTYLVEQNRTVGWSLPEHPEDEGQLPDIEEEMTSPPMTTMALYTPPAEAQPGEVPQDALSSSAAAPELLTRHRDRFQHHRWVLDNGLTVLFLENHALPVLSLEAYVDADQKYEIEQQAGVAVLTGQLLDEGTHSRSGLDIAQAIESVGGTLETQSRGVSAQVLSQDLALALDLMSDVLLRPTFDTEALEKKRDRLMASLAGEQDSLSLVAYKQFREMIYGSHPYHRPSKGYAHTLQALSRQDVLAYYDAYFRPNNTILSIVGDAEPSEIFDYAQRYFSGWDTRPISPHPAYTIPTPKGCVRQHIFREKEQIHVYLGHLGITRSNPDFYTLFTMDHILGVSPGFTDRISKALRDEQGLAYTVSANITFSAGREPGVFAAYIGTSPKNMSRAIEGFLQEIRKIRREYVSEEELTLAQNYITGSYVFSFETTAQLARYLINMERYHLGEDFIWNFPHLINQVTADDIQRVAHRYLDPDNYYIASAGRVDSPT